MGLHCAQYNKNRWDRKYTLLLNGTNHLLGSQWSVVWTVADVEHLVHNGTISSYYIFSPASLLKKKKKKVLTSVMLSCTCNKQSSPKQAAVRKLILCFLWSVKVRQQAHILQSSRLVQSTKYKHRYKWAFSVCASTKVVKPVAVRKIHLAGTCCCAYRVLKFALWSQNDGNWMWKWEKTKSWKLVMTMPQWTMHERTQPRSYSVVHWYVSSSHETLSEVIQ